MIVIIDGIIYDLTNFDHPGGNDIIELFTQHQSDLTMAFVSNHSRIFPHRKFQSYRALNYDKDFVDNTIKSSIETYKDYLELIQNVKDAKITPSPSNLYWCKLVLLLFFNIYLNYRLHFINWSFKVALILGYINALIGLNVQHDANHGSLSNNKTINKVFGLSQNLIGGSRKAWIIQHMVKHHVHTNVLGKDPDTDGLDVVRIHKESSRYWFHRFQYIYTLLGLPLFSYQILIIETYECIKNQYILDLISKCAFIYLNIVKPFDGTIVGFVKTQIPIMLTGAYLSLFFLLSHNYKGVPDGNNTKNGTFMENQITNSCNFKSDILTQVNGGLNYQIEHHLFPRYNHMKYKDLSVVVKKVALKYGYEYNEFSSFYENLKSTISYLFILGNK